MRCSMYYSVEFPRSNPAMALNLELVDALLKEQEEALSTVHRCQS